MLVLCGGIIERLKQIEVTMGSLIFIVIFSLSCVALDVNTKQIILSLIMYAIGYINAWISN